MLQHNVQDICEVFALDFDAEWGWFEDDEIDASSYDEKVDGRVSGGEFAKMFDIVCSGDML